MRVRNIIICLVAASIVGLTCLVLRSDAELPVENQASMSSTSKVRTVGALGRLEPQSRIRRISPWSDAHASVIALLHVTTGESVVAGQLLATLDSHNRLSADVAVAAANLQTARAKLERIIAGVDPRTVEARRVECQAAESRLKMLRGELERANKLIASRAISTQELDQVQWRLDDAVLQQKRLEKELQAIESVRNVDIDLAKAEVRAAEAELIRQQASLEASQVRAPIAGKILRIHAREGERVGEKGILELADVSRMQVVAEVFEADVERVQEGMQAKLQVMSSGAEYVGWVVERGRLVGRQTVLSLDPVSDVDARVVEVRIDLEPTAVKSLARLSNARVQVRIDTVNQPQESRMSALPGVERQ